MIDFILRPFRRNFGKDKHFYAAIDDMFGFIPNNIELYKLALIHKSASVTTDDGQQVNNERLEYLGDAIIESVSSDYLFIEFPDRDEGFLTQLRSKMVSRQMLNEVAKRIGLDDYVISNTSNNSSQKHIYGDAFEAMMGAIYLDQGYDFVNRLLINKIFVDYIKVDTLCEEETDFKSRLIEWCQKNHHSIRFETPRDKNYSSSHPSFYCKVLIDNIEVGYGAGDSKKEAEQRAALSVAQGVSDADCTKLMDKLDSLEMHQLKPARDEKKSSAKEVKSENKPKNRTKNKPQSEATPEPKEEAKSELEPNASVGEKLMPEPEPEPEPFYDEAEPELKKRGRKRKVFIKAKNDKGDSVENAEPATRQKSEISPEQSVEPKAEKKPAARRGRPRKSEANSTTADKVENADEPKPAVRRGRPRKKSVKADESGAEVGIQGSSDAMSVVE